MYISVPVIVLLILLFSKPEKLGDFLFVVFICAIVAPMAVFSGLIIVLLPFLLIGLVIGVLIGFSKTINFLDKPYVKSVIKNSFRVIAGIFILGGTYLILDENNKTAQIKQANKPQNLSSKIQPKQVVIKPDEKDLYAVELAVAGLFKEALDDFYSGSPHRVQSVVMLLRYENKALKDINQKIPPFQIGYTKDILQTAIDFGWAIKYSNNIYGISGRGKSILELLDRVPDEVKEVRRKFYNQIK